MEVRAAWSQPAREVVDALDVDPEAGLAGQKVRRRRERHGPNRLRTAERQSLWAILWDQVKSVIILLLALAIGLSLAFGQYIEALAIGVVVVVNTAIGFFTELRAVRSMESLRELGKADSKVRRDGREQVIPAVELVPGDIVVLEQGEVIGADVRLLETDNLQVDESPLTGESTPVTKGPDPVGEDAALADRTSMGFKGTAVTRGNGLGVVVRTGMDTEIGGISKLVEGAEESRAPLEQRLDTLGRRLVWLTIAVAVLVSVAGILAGQDVFRMIETGIALSVAAVPEGLPIVATIALARGVRRMARRNALVRRLSSVQTLGSVTVICSDKTGTLTESRMTVTRLALAHRDLQVGEGGEEALFREDGRPIPTDEDPLLDRALRVAVLANEIEALPDDPHDQVPGDPLELALLRLGRDARMPRSELVEAMPRTRLVPFDRETGMAASFHQTESGGGLVAVKGAPEAVLEASTRIAGKSGDRDLSSERREAWLERVEELAGEGLRLLGLAYRDDGPESEPFQDLVFLGLAGLVDPPRPEVSDAVGQCRDAGIRVVMVTGDHPATARYIARSVGIGGDAVRVVTGSRLQAAGAEPETREDVVSADVFARVDPAQKLQLIDGLQERGQILAMTGDGVNDAPALKKADIGIAMGERGTEVAREAADMVLLDDAFSTIVEAVRNGRIIFRNVRKFIVYLLSGNVGEILAVGAATVAGAPLPLLPLQILYLNLVNDVFPALALGLGRGEGHVMAEPPRDPDESILEPAQWQAIGGYGVLVGGAILAAFFYALHGLRLDTGGAVTTAFLVLSGGRLLHVFNMRDPHSRLLSNEVTRNPHVWAAILLCIGLLALAIYVEPLATVLSLTPPAGRQWLVITAGSAAPLVLGQLFLAVRGRLDGGNPEPGPAASRR